MSNIPADPPYDPSSPPRDYLFYSGVSSPSEESRTIVMQHVVAGILHRYILVKLYVPSFSIGPEE